MNCKGVSSSLPHLSGDCLCLCPFQIFGAVSCVKLPSSTSSGPSNVYIQRAERKRVLAEEKRFCLPCFFPILDAPRQKNQPLGCLQNTDTIERPITACWGREKFLKPPRPKTPNTTSRQSVRGDSPFLGRQDCLGLGFHSLWEHLDTAYNIHWQRLISLPERKRRKKKKIRVALCCRFF